MGWFKNCVAFGLAVVVLTGCGKSTNTITVTGSDTMVSLAGKWAGSYSESHPGVSIEVSGGGTGAGIAGLMSETVQIATASHELVKTQKDEIQAKSGRAPQEFRVAIDAIAIYVNKENRLDQISFEQLAEIFGDGGKYAKWSDIDPSLPDEKIIALGRESNSGTYQYFHEKVVGKERRFKKDVSEQSGSRDVVNQVTTTKGAIGYSGMGYITPDVKVLKLSEKTGGEAFPPSVETALAGKYPLARPLYIYTLGEPTGGLKEFVDWIQGEAGQKVVKDAGFVPLK